MKPGDPPRSPVDRNRSADTGVLEELRSPSGSGPARIARISGLFAMVIAVYALHQDFWNWRRIEPMVFGFVPVGLAYHIAYSFAAAAMMAVLVKFAWPEHLEKYEARDPSTSGRHEPGKS